LQRAVDQGIIFVTTLDTLSACHGIDKNAHALAHLGAEFIYGSEIGHNDVPWGINAEELHRMLSLTGMDVINLFKSATISSREKP
jgi:glucokinase